MHLRTIFFFIQYFNLLLINFHFLELMRHIQDFMATNELSSMKKDYTKNFDDLSNWIRVSEEKLSTQQSLTGRNIHDNDLFNWHYDIYLIYNLENF